MGQSVSPDSLHCNKETYFEVWNYIFWEEKTCNYASQVLLLDVLFYYYYLTFSLCLMLFLLSSLFSQTIFFFLVHLKRSSCFSIFLREILEQKLVWPAAGAKLHCYHYDYFIIIIFLLSPIIIFLLNILNVDEK